MTTSRLPILLRQMHQELHCTDIASKLAVEGLVLQIKAELMRFNDERGSRQPAWLAQAEEFLRAHSDRCLSMDDIAAACGTRPRRITNSFRRFKGCTPAEYHRQLRLTKAQRKLAATIIPIAQIASECGFFDQSHFSHIFRKTFGCTPFSYRHLMQRP